MLSITVISESIASVSKLSPYHSWPFELSMSFSVEFGKWHEGELTMWVVRRGGTTYVVHRKKVYSHRCRNLTVQFVKYICRSTYAYHALQLLVFRRHGCLKNPRGENDGWINIVLHQNEKHILPLDSVTEYKVFFTLFLDVRIAWPIEFHPALNNPSPSQPVWIRAPSPTGVRQNPMLTSNCNGASKPTEWTSRDR